MRITSDLIICVACVIYSIFMASASQDWSYDFGRDICLGTLCLLSTFYFYEHLRVVMLGKESR
jgi:hypothetical protein